MRPSRSPLVLRLAFPAPCVAAPAPRVAALAPWLAVLMALAAPAALSTACGRPQIAPADLLITNARVYTADEQRPWAGAVAVSGGRIVWVGGSPEAERLRSERTHVIDAGGRLVLPGFIDSHLHTNIGTSPDVLELGEAGTLEVMRAALAAFAARRAHLPWIEAQGWRYTPLPDGRLPEARDLEGIAPGRPIFIVSYDAHTVLLNREGVRRLGITRATERLPFGEVEHDARTGEPNGRLGSFSVLGLSSAGQEALTRILPSYTEERRYEQLKRNFEMAAGFGITTIVEPQAFLEDLPVFRRALEEGALRSRLQVALFHPRDMRREELARFEAARREYAGDRLRVSAIKLYIDDVIEPHTAAMLEPYADAPGTRGDTFYPPQEFAELVTRLDRSLFQLFIHATGDRGIRTALDALEQAGKANGPRDSRHQLVHVECLAPADVPRFASLGVVACMQPRHSAPEVASVWAKAVGAPRWDTAWAFRSLKEAGAVLAFASDWNVAEMDPLIGIYTAVTRAGLEGGPPTPWGKGQNIDVETAVRAYTIQGAWANFLDADRGSISEGKYADLVVLSDDIFERPPQEIPKARVLLTLVGGEEVHRAADASF